MRGKGQNTGGSGVVRALIPADLRRDGGGERRAPAKAAREKSASLAEIDKNCLCRFAGEIPSAPNCGPRDAQGQIFSE